MPIVKKSPPWETFFNEVSALFSGDPDIDVMHQYTEDKKQINIYVRNDEKYLLLQKYLPESKLFGTVNVLINLIPANGKPKARSAAEEMKILFGDNKAVSRVITKDVTGGNLTYVAFKNGAVQFYDDNMADLKGNKTMLMESIARDVLNLPIDGVYFCTDVPETKKAPEVTVEHKKVSKSDFDKLLKDLLW